MLAGLVGHPVTARGERLTQPSRPDHDIQTEDRPCTRPAGPVDEPPGILEPALVDGSICWRRRCQQPGHITAVLIHRRMLVGVRGMDGWRALAKVQMVGAGKGRVQAAHAIEPGQVRLSLQVVTLGQARPPPDRGRALLPAQPQAPPATRWDGGDPIRYQQDRRLEAPPGPPWSGTCAPPLRRIP